MTWLQSTYTIRLNHRHKLIGHVLIGRYQAQLEALNGKAEAHHFGELRMETAQAKAEGIIGEELARLGWQEADRTTRRKQDPDKVQLAACSDFWGLPRKYGVGGTPALLPSLTAGAPGRTCADNPWRARRSP